MKDCQFKENFIYLFFIITMLIISGCGSETVNDGNQPVVKEKEVFIKTNSPQFDTNASEETITIKGFESKAYLFNGDSNKWASWKPNVSGDYEIFVHIPSEININTNVYYKILLDGSKYIFANLGDNISDQWVKLVASNNKSIFRFTENGFVLVFMGYDEEGYPGNSATSNLDSRISIPIDAIKFVKINNPSIDLVVDNGTSNGVGEITTVASLASTPINDGQTVITSIGGYNAGGSVLNARWQGQPNSAPNRGKYFNAYAVESQYDGEWVIKGRNFGNIQGYITFWPPYLDYRIPKNGWKNDSITIIPKAINNYGNKWWLGYEPSLTLTLWIDDGVSCRQGPSTTIPIIGVIQTRGFGQCTWWVAQARLIMGFSTIPMPAYQNKKITTDYVPAFGDGLTYGSKHVAIIITPPTKEENIDSNGNIFTKYSFYLQEMNATWNEDVDTTYLSFVIKTNTKGQRSITTPIGSKSGYSATGYYRGL